MFYLGWAAGDTDEAVAAIRKLISRDPLSPYLCGMFAILLASLGEVEATEWASRASALDPDAFLSLFVSQIAASAIGDWPRTIAVSEALFAAGGRLPPPVCWYALARHRNGHVAGARAVYDDLKASTNNGERAPFSLACVAAELGLIDDAVASTRAAIARRDPTMFAFGRGRLTPVEALRQLPVYDELMPQVNWPTSVYRYPG